MSTATQERERRAFLEARRAYLGGTDVAAILGVSKWSTPLQVWREKTSAPDPDAGTLAMRRGLALEPFIAREFERDHPGLVTFRSKPVVRTDWGFPAGASVDRFVAERAHPRTPVAILEAKTAFQYGWREWDEKTGELPDAYFVQQQWYLAVTELPLSYGAADVGDPARLRTVPVHANPAIQERCVEAARTFWHEHVLTGIPPEPSGADGDARILRELYRRTIPDPPVVLDGPEAAQLAADYLRFKHDADAAKREAETAKQKLCALMGEHERALAGGYLLSWKAQERTTIDTKALRAAHPAIAGEFTRTTETRVFGTPKETR